MISSYLYDTFHVNTLLHNSFDDYHSEFKITQLKIWQRFRSVSTVPEVRC